jgi:hypothetical protein
MVTRRNAFDGCVLLAVIAGRPTEGDTIRSAVGISGRTCRWLEYAWNMVGTFLQAAKHAAWELCAGVKGAVPEVTGSVVVVGGIAADVTAVVVVLWAFVKANSKTLVARVVRRRILNDLRNSVMKESTVF